MRRKQGANHPHLLMVEFKEQLKRTGINLKDIITQMNIDYYQMDRQTIKDVLHRMITQVTASSAYQRFQQQSHERIKDQIDTLYTSQSRKHTYLVDCYKEVTAFPLVKQRENGAFNYAKLYKRTLSKQLRRVVWSRQFNKEFFRKTFLLVDREVTPYNVMEELKLSLDKLANKEGIALKQNQKDTALRIMQYFVKVSNKIPHRYHNYLVIIVVDLFSFYTISKITDLGAIGLGLVGISESYRETDVQARFGRIMRAITIIDEESATFIQQQYLQEGNGKRELNECYEYFRLTLGASHLSIQICQFLIDQLIIRKFCPLDMYVLFAIMILIISDDFEKSQKHKPSLKEILDRSKSIIKLQDFVDAYKTIYESIPAYHSTDDMQNLSKNKLFLEMISCSNTKVSKQEDDFIIENDTPARIGNQM